MNKIKMITICLVMLFFFAVITPFSGQLQAIEKINKQEGAEKYPTLHVSLGEEFVLHANQSAKIEKEDFGIKIIQFYNSPCPPDSYCFWSGVGIAFEYYHSGEVKRGIDLAQAFGYQTTIINSDNETYAKLKITKAVN